MALTEGLAAELGLTAVRPLAGGEFGATLVRGSSGELMVLKVLQSERLLGAVARGAGLANRLRASGYPSPEYVGTGAFEGSTWSLQRMLPGELPAVLTEAHAAGLLALAELHKEVAEDSYEWQ